MTLSPTLGRGPSYSFLCTLGKCLSTHVLTLAVSIVVLCEPVTTLLSRLLLCFQRCDVLSSLYVGMFLVSTPELVLCFLPLPLHGHVTNGSQRGELFMVSSDAFRLDWHLSCLVGPFIPLHDHMSWYPMNDYSHFLFSQLLGTCNDMPSQLLALS